MQMKMNSYDYFSALFGNILITITILMRISYAKWKCYAWIVLFVNLCLPTQTAYYSLVTYHNCYYY